ncbi:hypothetical protein [Paenibacillus shenyangensis]|uniref:hypothetical protein n=1 Tax=Paenibacillus sp. A9 TaxID=1284352 RepID=UPI0003628820|nr:hypothetical protein [Paenibacillus sp. A9]
MKYKILTTAAVMSIITATVSLPVFATEANSGNAAASVSVQTETTDKAKVATESETDSKTENIPKDKVKDKTQSDTESIKKKEQVKPPTATSKPATVKIVPKAEQKPKDATAAKKELEKKKSPVVTPAIPVPSAPIVKEPVEIIATRLDASALVPENFDKTILINLLGSESQNIVVRLDKINDYLYSEEIEPGQYEVSFVNIVGENAADYSIDFERKVTIRKGEVNKLNMQINEKMLQSGETDPPKEYEGVSQEHLEKMLNTNTTSSDENKSVLETEVAKDPFIIAAPAEKEVSKPVTMSPAAINMILWVAIILGGSLLFFLYKKISYKHDYYDC